MLGLLSTCWGSVLGANNIGSWNLGEVPWNSVKLARHIQQTTDSTTTCLVCNFHWDICFISRYLGLFVASAMLLSLEGQPPIVTTWMHPRFSVRDLCKHLEKHPLALRSIIKLVLSYLCYFSYLWRPWQLVWLSNVRGTVRMKTFDDCRASSKRAIIPLAFLLSFNFMLLGLG